MAAVNKVILIGNLGRDPEIRKNPSGSSVCSFSMATTDKFTDKQGNRQEQTEWHNIVAWNRSAETMAQYLKKGSPVYVEGKLKTQSWDDNGTKKYRTEILVTSFQFLGGGQGQSSGQQNSVQNQSGGSFNQPNNFSGGPQYNDPPFGFGGNEQYGNDEVNNFYNS